MSGEADNAHEDDYPDESVRRVDAAISIIEQRVDCLEEDAQHYIQSVDRIKFEIKDIPNPSIHALNLRLDRLRFGLTARIARLAPSELGKDIVYAGKKAFQS